MAGPYEMTDSFEAGDLPVGDGHTIRWTVSGNPDGKPAVLLHGGPGAGSSPRHRRMFDPARYRIVQFDQRNCGESTPYAGDSDVDLSTNTTAHLIADIEHLRHELGIDRWLVWGGSWGSVLGLAYAEAHPESVTELVLSIVLANNSADVEWATRTVGRIVPERWQAFRDHLPPDRRDGNLARAYNDLLMNADPAVHEPAALAWCDWEDTHMAIATGYEPSLRNQPPAFRLCFARLVTHYWANAAFLDEDHLLRNATNLGDTPTFLSHGRLDISSPMDFPVAVAAAIPNAELFIAERDGHGGPEMMDWTTTVTDRLSRSQ
jgi:proline iminopeptidase